MTWKWTAGEGEIWETQNVDSAGFHAIQEDSYIINILYINIYL